MPCTYLGTNKRLLSLSINLYVAKCQKLGKLKRAQSHSFSTYDDVVISYEKV